MIKLMLTMAAAVAVTGTAENQDYTGNVDPSAYSLPTVMHSAINARAARDKRATNRSSSREAAATCANLPKARARFGAHDWRVMRLERLCREAGFVR